jgi:predicted nuclease with TOPRIM domain
MSIKNQIIGLIRELGNQRDGLVIEVRELNGRISELRHELSTTVRDRDALVTRMENRVTELEEENQNLLKRVGELNNSSVYKLQEENEALKKRVEVAEELLLNEPPATSTDKKVTATIEAWLVGHAADRLRLVWATEGYVRSINWAIAKRVNEVSVPAADGFFGPVKVTL